MLFPRERWWWWWWPWCLPEEPALPPRCMPDGDGIVVDVPSKSFAAPPPAPAPPPALPLRAAARVAKLAAATRTAPAAAPAAKSAAERDERAVEEDESELMTIAKEKKMRIF